MSGGIERILVIALAGIGDALLATPLIRELRENFPGARIDALVLWAGSRDLLEGNPHINRVFQRNLMKEGKAESLRFLRELGKNRYDVSINAHPQSRIHYRLAAAVVGAPLRLSHQYECSGMLDRLLVNRCISQDYRRHTVDNNFDFLPLLGAAPKLAAHRLEVYLTETEERWAEKFLEDHSLKHSKVLGIHAGSGGTKNLRLKRWPQGHYIELLKRLTKSAPDATVLLFGGPDEDGETQEILAAVGSPRLIRAKTENLRQAGALMRRCTSFLSVDTALMHLAAAVKAPRQIVIEAPTLNVTNQPYGNPFTLVPNPAVAGRHLEFYRYDGRGIRGTREELIRCMESVTVEAVLEAVSQALGA